MIAGRYSLEDQIGVGGMAAVWRATDTLLGRQVAIKRLSPHLQANRDASERFRREGQAAARLSHPGILTVFDAGEDDDGPWIAMELIEGETLAHHLAQDGPMDIIAVASFMEQAASAVDYAHENGIVHRDIKPANLMIEPGGRVRLADFGIAKPLEDSVTITSPGEVVGTISYVAPEIIEGKQASPASDIYSLAAVAYEMLAGEKPYKAETTAGLLELIRRAEGPVLAGKVPPEAAPALARALSGDPSARPESAKAFAAELSQVGTLVLPPAMARTDEPAPVTPGTGSSPDEPTILVSPALPPDRQSGGLAAPESEEPAPVGAGARRGIPGRVMATTGGLVILAMVVALALALGRPDADAAVTTAVTTTAATTVSTTVPTTISTTGATATSATAASATVLLVERIKALLVGLGPPDYKPKDLKEIEDGVDRAIEKWEENDPQAAGNALDQVVSQVDKFPESEVREELSTLLSQLAEAMSLN